MGRGHRPPIVRIVRPPTSVVRTLKPRTHLLDREISVVPPPRHDEDGGGDEGGGTGRGGDGGGGRHDDGGSHHGGSNHGDSHHDGHGGGHHGAHGDGGLAHRGLGGHLGHGRGHGPWWDWSWYGRGFCHHGHPWWYAILHHHPHHVISHLFYGVDWSWTGYSYEGPGWTAANGWAALRRAEPVEAMQIFAALRGWDPYDGEASIGYALAAGLAGDDVTAADAMRRGLRDDPAALERVPDDAPMRVHVRTLLRRAAARARSDVTDLDALFMVAVLNFVLDEHAISYYAVDGAIRAGDTDDSALNLMEMAARMVFGEL